MPATVTISKKLSDRHWLAIGSFKSSHSATCGPAEIILQETDAGLTPVLDNSLHQTTILNRQVTAYVDAPVVDIKPEVNQVITFLEFSFTLKSAKTDGPNGH